MSATYTKNFNLPLPNFNYSTWHDYYYTAMQVIDAAMAQYIQAFAVDGIWSNSTAYVADNVVVDPDAGTLWKCLVDHTSDATGSFEDYRVANPTYWSSFSFRPAYRGTWTTGTDYNLGEFVVDPSSYIYAICNTTHTAGATFAGDSSYWDYLIDVSSFGANVDTLAAIVSNITSVAGISADVTTVASVAGDVTVTAGISADISTLADIEDGTTATDAISDLAVVASSIHTVAGIAADVTTIAPITTEIVTVAGDSSDIQVLAPASSDIQTLTTYVTDIATLADIEDGTVATNAISDLAAIAADVQACAADLAVIGSKADDDLSNVTPATGRTALGLVIGTDVQSYFGPVDTITTPPADGDALTFNGTNWVPSAGVADFSTVAENILPDADSTRSLGSATLAWAGLYADEILGVGADVVIKRIGGTNTTPVAEGLAKAWANLNGTGTIALRDSLNVSSVTDNGTGDYTFTWTNNMANSDYSASSMVRRDTDGSIDFGNFIPEIKRTLGAVATGSLSLRCGGGGQAALYDADTMTASVHGDLA